MTRDDILAMEPGREMDALIAQHVLGFAVVRPAGEPEPLIHRDVKYGGSTWSYAGKMLCYSSTIGEAWSVFRRMAEDWPDAWLGNRKGRFAVGWGFDGHGWDYVDGSWDEAPAIICRAALLAVMDLA